MCSGLCDGCWYINELPPGIEEYEKPGAGLGFFPLEIPKALLGNPMLDGVTDVALFVPIKSV